MRPRHGNTLKYEVGKRLKSLMKDMTAKEFSKCLDHIVSDNMIWSYVNGHTLPSVEVLMKISEKCKVPIDWILHGKHSSDMPLSPETLLLAKKFEDKISNIDNGNKTTIVIILFQIITLIISLINLTRTDIVNHMQTRDDSRNDGDYGTLKEFLKMKYGENISD